MNWYTNPDWWSAIGQWVGGIGTLVAVWIALRQMNETRKLQYELLRPEIDVHCSPSGYSYVIDYSLDKEEDWEHVKCSWFDRFMSGNLHITISNPKQTPVGNKSLCVLSC